jgi:hypothetical protein
MVSAKQPIRTRRTLSGSAWYEVAADRGAVRLYIHEASGHDVALRLTPVQVIRLREDLDLVASSIKQCTEEPSHG